MIQQMKRAWKRALKPPAKEAAAEALTQTELLLGRMASWQVRSRRVISCLQDVEFCVSSQWGEDGILDWLVERAGVPAHAHSFVEFGVETYREANTRFLLQNRNWRGLILDGSPAVVDAVREDGLAWRHDLTAVPAFITRENINELIGRAGFSGEIGVLSIDIDGNDYWVWEAIEVVRPILCVCEYNAVFGDVHPVSVPYDPAFRRSKAHRSNLYFGASIAALRSLAAKKGYRFVGTTMAANDAFFVREDVAARFVDECIERVVALPSFARESRNDLGQLTYATGLERLSLIADLAVIQTETGARVRLGDLQEPYGEEWLALMTGKPVCAGA